MTRATLTGRVLTRIQHSRLAANNSPYIVEGFHHLQRNSYSTIPLANNGFFFTNLPDFVHTSLDKSVRGMAIKRRRKVARSNKPENENLPLMNEKLIKKMMADFKVSSPRDISLRLLVERDSTSPTTSEETSLEAAIETSLDLGLDLVEIDLKNPKLPVVRVVDYEAKLYRVNKEKAKKKTKDPGTIMKEFRFRAKTADHDFQRKLSGVLEALQKGHKCKIQARCPKRVVLTTNPEGALEVINRVVEEVGSHGEQTRAPEVNKEKTNASVLLVPTNKRKKS